MGNLRNGTEGGWQRQPKDVPCPKCGESAGGCLRMGGHIACLKKKSGERNGPFFVHRANSYGPISMEQIPASLYPQESGLNIVCLNDVEAKSVEWLWRYKLPLGMLVLFAGQPGIGKSMVTCWLTGAVTTGGEWPDDAGDCPSGSVVLLTAEDSLAHTIRPRLDAAGADCRRVFCIQGTTDRDEAGNKVERGVRLDMDIKRIEALLEGRPDIRLVIIDPINAYMGKIDAHKDAEVRRITTPLSSLAERFGVTIILVTHFSKPGAGGAAIYRAMGSLAFVASARIAWAFVTDANDQDRILMLPLKCNIAKRPPGMAYRVVDGCIEWEDGSIDISADEAMAAAAAPRKRDKMAEAIAWLKQRLADGMPVESDALLAEARAAGISFSTFKRAKTEAGVISTKERGLHGRWMVSRPPDEPLSPLSQMDNLSPLGLLSPLDPLPEDKGSSPPSQEAQEVQEDQEFQESELFQDDWTAIARDAS